MNWSKWKMGLLVSGLSGLLTGLIGLTTNLTAKEIWLFVVMQTAKDMLLYLKENPVTSVQDSAQPPSI